MSNRDLNFYPRYFKIIGYFKRKGKKLKLLNWKRQTMENFPDFLKETGNT